MADRNPQHHAPNQRNEATIWFIVAAVLGVLAVQWFLSQPNPVETIPYSQFRQLVADNQVQSVLVGEDKIQGELKRPLANGKTHFVTDRVDDGFARELASRGIKVEGVPSAGWIGIIMSWVIPLVIFYAIWVFLIRRFAGQGLGGFAGVGKSRAKIYVEKGIKTTFSDVAGVDEAKFELQEIVEFLKDPKTYGRLGARVPKGILLVGPPGTGKTLLARAVAGEAGVPFFSISGSEFVEMFVGVGAARVRDLFEQARKAAPAIIFIDELDSLGRSRTSGGYAAHDEKEQTLNQLLAELDGFDPSVGVVVLSATNRPEVLDPALLRAGRFDRQVLVDRPDRAGRLAILKVHITKIRTDSTVDLDKVAALTTGFTGADLANLINEAAIAATRRNAEAVSLADFTTAFERIVAGLEKRSRVLTPSERRRIAYHEMGHALVAATLPGVDPVHKVSIIPRGMGALGYTMQRPTEDRYVLAESELQDRLAVLMGGRAAERLVYGGDVSTGAADDLQRATEIALEMVARYGMNPVVGQRTYAQRPLSLLTGTQDREVSAAEDTAREIDVAVRDLIEKASRRAEDILTHRRKELDQGAALLLEKETLTIEEFPPLRQAAPEPAAA